MPRKAFISSPELPYHVYNRTEDRNFYSLASQEIWDLYSDNLAILALVYGIKIHAFVLMSNHYHLVASAPDQNLPEAIRYLQSQVSRNVGVTAGTQRYRFGQRYKWKLVYNHSQYLTLLRYVYQNPVRAGLSKSCESYPWSSLYGLYGGSRLNFPLEPSLFPEPVEVENPDYYLEWLNPSLDQAELKKVRGMFKKVQGMSEKETGT